MAPLPTHKPSSGNEPEKEPALSFERLESLNTGTPVLNPPSVFSATKNNENSNDISNDDEEEYDELEPNELDEDFEQDTSFQIETPRGEEPSSTVSPVEHRVDFSQPQENIKEEEMNNTQENTTYVDQEEDHFDVFSEKQRREEIASLSDDAKENAKRLLERIAEDDSSEVLLNGPTEIMFKRGGQRYYDRKIRFEDIETYHKVINLLILHETDTDGRIGKDKFLIEGQLELPDYDNPNSPPLFARVHVIAPPVVKAAKVTIAKKAKKSFTLEDLQARGAMSLAMAAFLQACAKGKATIVFSGLSGSGKTTLLESMSHHFDENDRVVVVEDTAELRLPLPDVVYLLSTARKPGQDISEMVTLEWLVSQANRMRPDRIIVGEIRGGELAEFLSAANSGADGSMTTVHASSPRQTIEKMLSLAMKSTSAKSETSVLRDISSTVQIVVQTALIDGRHIISQIEEISDTIVNNGTGIASTPLFEYDRNSGQFSARGKPSDKFNQFLGQRGVDVNPAWFSRNLSY